MFVGIKAVMLGNHAGNDWQDIAEGAIPAGTDMKIVFNINGYKLKQIEAAIGKMDYVADRNIGLDECWIIIARQDTLAMRGYNFYIEPVTYFRDRLRELLGMRACLRCGGYGYYFDDNRGPIEPCDVPGCVEGWHSD